MRGLSLVVASGGHSSSWCAGLSLSRPLLLRSIGSRRAGSVIVAHRPSCSVACGIFPDQGSNPCPLHWQADSQPLRHQGSPLISFIIFMIITLNSFWGRLPISISLYSSSGVLYCSIIWNMLLCHLILFPSFKDHSQVICCSLSAYNYFIYFVQFLNCLWREARLMSVFLSWMETETLASISKS